MSFMCISHFKACFLNSNLYSVIIRKIGKELAPNFLKGVPSAYLILIRCCFKHTALPLHDLMMNSHQIVKF